jgi:hypothetical protein
MRETGSLVASLRGSGESGGTRFARFGSRDALGSLFLDALPMCSGWSDEGFGDSFSFVGDGGSGSMIFRGASVC